MFTPQLLAAGQLTNAKATLYEVPTGMRCIVDVVRYYNTTGGALVCDLFANNGTSRQLDKISVPANSPHLVIDKNAPSYLDAGVKIEGNTTANTSVNYFIYGQLEQKG